MKTVIVTGGGGFIGSNLVKYIISNTDWKVIFVKDRPGHDMRYAIDPLKIQNDLGWKPEIRFEEGIRKTVNWYLDNSTWYKNILNSSYKLEKRGLNLGKIPNSILKG